MARIFITLPGGKRKRISGRFRGGKPGLFGKDYYAVNDRPAVVRSRRALQEIRSYLDSNRSTRR
jgi:hypothetical protein